MAIGNRSIPRVYLLPPGELKVQNILPGKYFAEINKLSLLTVVSLIIHLLENLFYLIKEFCCLLNFHI
jgi:hypothetical protein